MNCDTVTKQLPLVLYGDLSFDDEELVHDHLADCPACQSELDSLRRMHRSFDAAESCPPPQLLQDSRRQLRVTVAALSAAGVSPRRGRFAFLQNLWPALPAWQAVAAAVLVVGAFVAGRLYPGDAPKLVREAEPLASRVRYVQPEASGRVQIVLEEVRQKV